MPCVRKKLGLIVNPIAGMGGSVGLKGTDGTEVLARAIELGATPTAPARTVDALNEIAPFRNSIDLISYPHDMGEREAKACGFEPKVIGSLSGGKPTPIDTKNAARDMFRSRVDLVLFAGGDGTARDICEASQAQTAVLGIPTGVKMFSGVFAVNPRAAGRLAVLFLQGKVDVREAEVMDIDEEDFRHDRLSARLYGYLRVPYEKRMTQDTKISSGNIEEQAVQEIAQYVIDNMQNDCLYVIGPGTTTKSIMRKLGLKHTLLGVDLVYDRKVLAWDVTSARTLELVKKRKAKIVVTVIGGQGFIFGRGNQQISPEVIKQVGKENIIVIASENKIASLEGRPMLVDTGDHTVDETLRGYIRIETGYGKTAIYMVA
jgi:predicted polyphosphate/ATP-dependent NAD kinase